LWPLLAALWLSAGSWTGNSFLYKPSLGASGATQKGYFDTGMDRVDGHLGRQKILGDPGYGTVTEALTTIGSSQLTLVIPAGTVTVSADTTIPANVALRVLRGGIFSVADTKTLTINGSLEAGPYQIFSLSGTGAVAGFAKVPELLPEWWGSDSAAFSAALSAALASGQTVLLGQTAYNLSSGWSAKTLTGNLKMRAKGGKPTITGAAGVNFATAGAYSIDVEGIKWDTWLDVFNFTSLTGAMPYLRVHNCEFTNLASGALYGVTAGAGSAISRADITNNIFNTMLRGVGLQVRGLADIHLSGNTFLNIGYRGIQLGWSDYAYQEAWSRYVVQGNTFKNIVTADNVGNHAILLYGYSASIADNKIENVVNGNDSDSEGIYIKCRYATITGNTVIDGGRGEAFINIKGDERGVTSGPQGFAVVCAHNNLKSSAAYESGHSTSGINISNDDVLVQGNVLEGFNRSPIATNATEYDNIQILDNHIYGATGTLAIDFVSPGKNHRICGNLIDNMATASAQGISLALSDAAAMDVEVSGNRINNLTANAIRVKPSATYDDYITAIIRNNIISNCSAALKTETARALKITFVGNELSNVTTPITASVAPTDWFIADNRITLQTTDGSATTIIIVPLASNKAALVEAACTANQSDNSNRAGYQQVSLWYNNGGTATQQGATASLFAVESNASWDFTVNATSASVRGRVTGVAATTINWSLTQFKLVTR
jgi:hypothetical protein